MHTKTAAPVVKAKVLSSKALAAPLAAAMFGLTALSVALSPVIAEAAPVGQIETKEVPASRLFPLLKGFLSQPASARDQIQLAYVVRVKHVPVSALDFKLKDGANVTKLTLGSDNRITPLPTLAQLNRNAVVVATGPNNVSLAMKLKVYSTQSPARTLSAADMTKAVNQTQTVGKKAAGPAAMLISLPDRVFFAGAGRGTVTLSNGQVKTLPVTTKGEYPAGTPYFYPSDYPGAATLNFERVPQRIEIDNP